MSRAVNIKHGLPVFRTIEYTSCRDMVTSGWPAVIYSKPAIPDEWQMQHKLFPLSGITMQKTARTPFLIQRA